MALQTHLLLCSCSLRRPIASFIRLTVTTQKCEVPPRASRVGPAFCSFGKSALGSKIEHSEKLLIVVLLVRSGYQLRPGSVDHIENVGETELARIDAVPPGRQAHNRTHEIVSRHSHKDFFFHHFLAPGVDVMKTYRSLQGAQIGFDVPAPAIQLHDVVDRQCQRGEQIQPLFRLAPSHSRRNQSSLYNSIGRPATALAAIPTTRLPAHAILSGLADGTSKFSCPHIGKPQYHCQASLLSRMGHRENAKVAV